MRSVKITPQLFTLMAQVDLKEKLCYFGFLRLSTVLLSLGDDFPYK